MPTAVTRKLEAPIEDRLKKQTDDLNVFKDQQSAMIQSVKDTTDKDVKKLQQDMNELKEAVAKQNVTLDRQAKHYEGEFKAVREEAKTQFEQLSNSLKDSMKHSLAKHDQVMSAQFQEIKNLLQDRLEHPSKKSRVEQDV